MSTYRIGTGFDVHPFVAGDNVVLGGVNIPHTKSLSGHSDADVLIHAIVDGILGALAWGDIGTWFPNTDPKYRGKASSYFLEQVYQKAVAEGWELVNCDSVILAEEPKIGAFFERIRENLAQIFSRAGRPISSSQISVKATTTERLGFIGRGEGIAAQAVILLERSR